MKRVLAVLTLTVAAAICGVSAAESPKLLVIIVVDQLRADYLSEFAQAWRGGFRTLLAGGAVFDRAAYPYLNTVTCAGHATIATGTYPHTHGMVLNGWWHRDERRLLECTADAAAPDISYGRKSNLGNSAKRLMAPTLADELRMQRPGAQVVTMSLKDRSAIGLAGHGATSAIWFEDTAGAFVTSRAFTASRVKRVREYLERNPIARDLGRIWALQRPAVEYRYRDAAVGERPPAGWTGRFPHPVAGLRGADTRFFTLWQSSPFSDAYLGRMAAAMVDAFELGQREATDFLGVSFSALDLVGHAFGPRSREAEDLLFHLDATLAGLIGHLDARVGRDRYVLGLSADHGVAAVAMPGGPAGRIATEDVRERIEETLIEQFGPRVKGSYVDAVNFTYVYLAPGVFETLRKDPEAMRAVTAAVAEIPGVDRVLRSDELSSTSPDLLVRAAALSHFPGRSGDLVIAPEPEWILAPRAAGNATTHGTAQPYDSRVPVILFGSGITTGRFDAEATPADIAPTLAQLAGLSMPRAEGRVLREALGAATSP
jgi:predicted AlkP superfamily pyrophosphatase or phosphodiesterase